MFSSLCAASDADLHLTQHAAARIQQRGIPSWYLRLLLEHGHTHHDGHGAVVKTVTRATRQRLQRHLSRKQYADAERYFGVYAVVSNENALITAAHRTHRRFS